MSLAFHLRGCGLSVIWGPGRVLTRENGRSQERVRLGLGEPEAAQAQAEQSVREQEGQWTLNESCHGSVGRGVCQQAW